MTKYTPEQRIAAFWSKVDSSAGMFECWNWNGAMDGRGYGLVMWNGYTRRAHRIAWILTQGEIPGGLCTCHHCDNRRCCNPQHLFLGTGRENTADMVAKGRNKWPDQRGEKDSQHKLSELQVEEIRRLYSQGDISQYEIAEQFGIHQSSVSYIVSRKRWGHL